MNNTAHEGSVFSVEAKSVIIWNNWTIYDNFALTSGVIRVVNDGHFEIYNSNIFQNYAQKNTISLIFNSGNLSKIDKWNIYDNLELTKDKILTEMQSEWSLLCFIPETVKTFISTNIEEDDIENSSKSMFNVLSASLEISNESLIHSQDVLINAFLSSIAIKDSEISNITLTGHSISIVASSLEFSNITVSRITTNGNNDFILVSFESSLLIRNIAYSSSNSVLFNLLSSKMSASNLSFTDITNSRYLFETYDWTKSDISNISATNVVTTSQSLISFKSSKELSLTSVVVTGTYQYIIEIDRSHFSNISEVAISKSKKAVFVKNSIIDMFQNSSFHQNGYSASKGGAIQIYDSEVTFDRILFENNVANVGGAINFDCYSLNMWELAILNSQFINNQAIDKGGALYYGFKRPNFEKIEFSNNTALYGNNYASYAVKIRLNESDTDYMEIDSIGPGIPYYKNISFALLDYDNQTIVTNSENDITITSSSSASAIAGVNSVLLQNGVATFSGLTAMAPPGSKNLIFKASSKAIDRSKITKIFGSEVSKNQLILNFRNCQPGEYISSPIKWAECSAQSFSLEWNSKECQDCLENAYWPGGSEIYLDPGYWRYSTNSTDIISCIRKDSWKGGYQEKQIHPVTCSKGYKGPLCLEWVFEGDDKYVLSGDANWEKCGSPTVNALKYLGICLLVFGFMMMLIVINVNKTKESKLSVLIRILTNYMQMIATITSFTTIYPSTLTELFLPSEKLGGASDTFISIDCFLPSSALKGPFPSSRLFKVFLTALMPFILTLVVSIIWIIVKYSFPRLAIDLKRCFVISFISIVFLLYAKIAEQSINVFRCVDFNENTKRAIIDLEMDWYSEDHIAWVLLLGLPITVIYVVGAPLLAFVLLYKNIRKGKESKINQYFLIFYQGYKHDRFYWEFVNTLRKMILLFMLLVTNMYKIAISVAVLVLTARIQVAIVPYKDVEYNRLEIFAITSAMVTVISLLIYFQDEEVTHLNLMVTLFLIVMNVVFLMEWFYKLTFCLYKNSKIMKCVSAAITHRWGMLSEQYYSRTEKVQSSHVSAPHANSNL
jgi:hypothetical protein